MIAVATLAVALATPARETLIERWQHADRTHTIARLNSAPLAPKTEATPAADLRALAASELGIPGRYQLASTAAPPHQPWWARLWQWVSDRWQQFWQTAFGRVHVGSQAAASIGDAVLVLLGLLILFVVVRLLMNLQLAREASRTLAAPLEDPPSPRALYRAASEAASRGDYGAAALQLFAATVALLERRGAVRVSKSATVGDLRRELRSRDAELVATFDAVAAPFVQRAYAERRIDESQWQRARQAFESLISPPQRALGG